MSREVKRKTHILNPTWNHITDGYKRMLFFSLCNLSHVTNSIFTYKPSIPNLKVSPLSKTKYNRTKREHWLNHLCFLQSDTPGPSVYHCSEQWLQSKSGSPCSFKEILSTYCNCKTSAIWSVTTLSPKWNTASASYTYCINTTSLNLWLWRIWKMLVVLGKRASIGSNTVRNSCLSCKRGSQLIKCHINKPTLTTKPSQRLIELSTPLPRKMSKDKYDPFKVRPTTQHVVGSERLTELEKPERHCF